MTFTVNLDYTTLDMQRRQHPAWRLLAADSAPLVASFLHRVFVVPNVRVMAQSKLAEALEDTLYGLREQLGSKAGAKAFPKSAQAYLNDWAANDKGWLRNFYPAGSDEPHFDLTPPRAQRPCPSQADICATGVRLEQERIGFGWVKAALAALAPGAPPASGSGTDNE